METLDRPHAPPPRSSRLGTEAEAPRAPRAKTKLVGPRAFTLLWDSHSVVGIVIGLGLFVIFYAGAFALYRGELHAWADPALRTSEVRASEATLTMDEVVAPIFAEAPPAPGADVSVNWPMRERAFFFVRYETAVGDTTEVVTAVVNPVTGERVDPSRATRFSRSSLSEILYRLHFFGQGGIWGEIVAGLIAVFLLFAVVSGVLIHLRKLPTDWHTFRPKVKLRAALADAHTVLGLVGLPFAAMYAITGAFLGLLVILLGPSVLLVFDGDYQNALDLSAGFEMPAHEPSGEPAEMLSFAEYQEALPAAWDGVVDATVMAVHGWGDANAIVQVFGDNTPGATSLTAGPQAVLRATTGEVLAQNNPRLGTALGGTSAAVVNLHYARMGPGTAFAKVVYFFLAMATASVILTGNILWVLVRRPKDPRATPRLHRFLARLTVGVGCGLVAAIPVLFLTTRALPLDHPSLTAWENAALFGVWAVLAASAFAGPSAVWAARWQLAFAAVLSLLVPIANGAMTGAWPWVSAASGWAYVLTVDLGFVLMAMALAWIASRLRPAADAPLLSGDGATTTTPVARPSLRPTSS
ncbi:MAG: PepSY-associated TM helix domain-containing protein [Bacteroidota bacterium]